MAKINGMELKASRTEQNEDKSSFKISSLYLGSVKVATVLFERNVPECEDSVQVFVRYPFSEEKLRQTVAALHPDQEGYSLEDLALELEWLATLEQEYLRHASSANGGMLALNLEGGQVTLGIPLRYAEASEEEILEASRKKIEEFEGYYGTLTGYLVFHSPDDFSRGDALKPEELTR